MRKLFAGLFILFCIPLYSIAQESVGFSNPDNIQPLLDYRMPEWGYTNFYLDFSMDGNANRTRFDGTENVSSDTRFTTHLSPVYFRFLESEARQSVFHISSMLDYFLDKSNDSNNQSASFHNYNFEINLNLEEKFYLEDSDVFVLGRVVGNFDQVKTGDAENQTNLNFINSEFARNVATNFSVGIGFGRMRNVNPIIRSLRFGERLRAINSNQTMNFQDYQSAAEQLTRLGGYNQVYDRPEKYFWGDMDTQISPDLSALNPFDLLYLTDTTKETIGSRMEGWEIQANLGFNYTTRYLRDNGVQTGNSISQNSSLIPSISGIWSKNLSLKHQLGLSADLTSFMQLNPDRDNTTFAAINVSWLYTITDRILSTTSTYFNYRFSGGSGLVTVNSEIDYFIENKFSLFSNILMAHRPKFLDEGHDRRNVQFIFSAGLRYYLKRELF